MKFVIQTHWRGRSTHIDFRYGEPQEKINGWTIMHAPENAVENPVTSLAEAKDADANVEYKIDIISGKPTKGNGLLAIEKKEHSGVWLKVEGVIRDEKEGVVHIIDSGTVEIGAQKEGYAEYFLDGEHWKGRIAFKMTPDDTWIYDMPDEQTPYVLGDTAIDEKWLPPKGESALPSSIEKLVPLALKYWNMGEKEALDARKEFAEQYDSQRAMVQPFGSPAGKRNVAKLIVSWIPDHKTYVEPFAGGAAVFWAKERSETEVLNDLYTEIYNAYKVLRDITPEQAKRLKRFNWNMSKELWRKLKTYKAKDPVERFWAWKHLSWMSFSHTGGYREKASKWMGISRLDKFKERLKGVKLHNEDWKSVIQKYDSPDTFFFVDPPYSEDFNDKLKIGYVPIVDVRRVLRNAKGKWMLTINDTPKNREYFKDFKIESVPVRKFGQKGHQKGVARKEIFILNYDKDKDVWEHAGKREEQHVHGTVVIRAAEEEGLIGGIVYPADKADSYGTYARAEVIREAMYYFMENGQYTNIEHEKAKKADMKIVECFQAESDTVKGGQPVRKGDWWITARILDNDIWDMVKSGQLRGFSWEGLIQVEN